MTGSEGDPATWMPPWMRPLIVPAVRTPVELAGLLKYDRLPAAEAVIAAWVEAGSHPDWHRAAQQTVRDAMPLLARSITRLTIERGREAVERLTREGPGSTGFGDGPARVGRLAQAVDPPAPGSPVASPADRPVSVPTVTPRRRSSVKAGVTPRRLWWVGAGVLASVGVRRLWRALSRSRSR